MDRLYNNLDSSFKLEEEPINFGTNINYQMNVTVTKYHGTNCEVSTMKGCAPLKQNSQNGEYRNCFWEYDGYKNEIEFNLNPLYPHLCIHNLRIPLNPKKNNTYDTYTYCEYEDDINLKPFNESCFHDEHCSRTVMEFTLAPLGAYECI